MGTTQSGSTRLFNLIRMIYEMKNKKVYSGFSLKNVILNKSNYDVIISKTHNTDFKYLKNFDFKILPIRNILDSAISAGIRKNNKSTEFYIEECTKNIILFNKFKSEADYIFRYENYDVYHIKQLCSVLGINLTNFEIIQIMKNLDEMLNSKKIVEKDDHTDKEYQTTLLSQHHNTSNGKSNKFINLTDEQLNDILKEENILTFLEENLYF